MENDPLEDDTQCGEIFISKNFTFRLICILCEKCFDNFFNFKNHCLNFDCSLALDDEVNCRIDVSNVTSITKRIERVDNHIVNKCKTKVLPIVLATKVNDATKIENSDNNYDNEPSNFPLFIGSDTSIRKLPEKVDNDILRNCESKVSTIALATKDNYVTDIENSDKNYDNDPANIRLVIGSETSITKLPEKLDNDILKNCESIEVSPKVLATKYNNFAKDIVNSDKYYNNEPAIIYDTSNKIFSTNSSTLKLPEIKKSTIYLCKICNHEFNSALKLSNHVRSDHMNKGLLQCPHCEKVFRKYSSIKLHIWLHLGEKPHRCELCDKRYAKKGSLTIHIDSVHKKLKDYECKICAKRFSYKVLLDRHQVVHTGEKAFKCQICNLDYKTRYSLSVHNRNYHPELLPYQCEKCLQRYSNTTAIKLHGCHPDNKEDKKCEGIMSSIGKRNYKSETINGCVKIVNSKEIPIFKRSRKKQQEYNGTNNDSMSYVCEFCGKGFKDSTQYKIHCRIHTGEKPYKCPQIDCNKKFATKSSLCCHYTVHTGEKIYKCTICEKRFRLISRLRVHLRSHTGERPFSCEFCQKGAVLLIL